MDLLIQISPPFCSKLVVQSSVMHNQISHDQAFHVARILKTNLRQIIPNINLASEPKKYVFPICRPLKFPGKTIFALYDITSCIPGRRIALFLSMFYPGSGTFKHLQRFHQHEAEGGKEICKAAAALQA